MATARPQPGAGAIKRILITGAGTGFGRDAAFGLAAKGHDVIATVHHSRQIAGMKDAAARRGVLLRVEKLDLLSETDRQESVGWDVDVLINNAAIGRDGPIAEIPMELLRQVFDVNVFATLALTQGIVRKMLEKRRGRIIFVSSIAGLTAGAYLGPYAASKHAIEAIAESMFNELAPHGIQVATLNPGPYGTGFNDQMAASWNRWYDPARDVTRPDELDALGESFERQFDPGELVRVMVELAESESGRYRNVHPRESEDLVRVRELEAWTRFQSSAGTPARDRQLIRSVSLAGDAARE